MAGPGSSKMEILLKISLTPHATPQDRTATLEVEPSASIKVVKDIVQDQEGILPALQILYFRGEFLQDDMLLSDYGIGEGDTLQLGQRTPGTHPMYGKPLLPREVELKVREIIPRHVWQIRIEELEDEEGVADALAWVQKFGQDWRQAEGAEDRHSLAAILQTIAHRALKYGPVGIGVMMVAQFVEMEEFAESLATAVTWLLRYRALDFRFPFRLPLLLNKLCYHPAFAPHAPRVTQLLVNALVNWVTPSPDLDTDLEQARAAKRLVSGMPVLATRQPAGLAQVYQQAKGVLVAAGGEGPRGAEGVQGGAGGSGGAAGQAPARRLVRGGEGLQD